MAVRLVRLKPAAMSTSWPPERLEQWPLATLSQARASVVHWLPEDRRLLGEHRGEHRQSCHRAPAVPACLWQAAEQSSRRPGLPFEVAFGSQPNSGALKSPARLLSERGKSGADENPASAREAKQDSGADIFLTRLALRKKAGFGSILLNETIWAETIATLRHASRPLSRFLVSVSDWLPASPPKPPRLPECLKRCKRHQILSRLQ